MWPFQDPPPLPKPDPWQEIYKPILMQSASTAIAIIALYLLYKISLVLSWTGDRSLAILTWSIQRLWIAFSHLTAIIINLGRIVTGLAVLAIIGSCFWIYTQGPSLQVLSQVELLYQIYKEITRWIQPATLHL